MLRYLHTGNCPRCGAPIYELMLATDSKPEAYFTCDCRAAMPALPAPGEEIGQPESVTTADEKAGLDALRKRVEATRGK